ncbi:iron ABC transporter permease [Hoyosella sp. G463]|uniref:Iron ABC transporter permease n=1 Tax=Lolliginicoccus lacisalsi TaxID=2742202 RepID=A0A927PL57_9ACTN|nr:iron ABC transporter permease [Lolliginicoccus lacisalsi]MBD8505086.1 iron ABC transporter permease [Lolliginicoccus lacisalsi]
MSTPTTSTVDRDARWRRLAPVLLIIVAVVSAATLLVGENNMLTPLDVIAVLASDDPVTLHEIAVNSRGPRIVLAIMVGAGLGAAGALLQSLVRNPLASPEFVGVSAGAVTATVAFMAFGPALAAGMIGWIRPLVATGGGLVAAVVVYLLARQVGSVESTRLLLVGIVTSGVLASVTTVSMIALGEQAGELLSWLSGSLALRTWPDTMWVAAYLVPGVALTLIAIPRVNLRQLGDDVAIGLGQRREWDRLIVLLAAVVLTAACVSIVGAIGFVGLIGPHIARKIVGNDARRLVPAAALGGALMVLIADFVSRNLDPAWIAGPLGLEVRNVTLPVGVYLTLFGVPFLLSLLWKAK